MLFRFGQLFQQSKQAKGQNWRLTNDALALTLLHSTVGTLKKETILTASIEGRRTREFTILVAEDSDIDLFLLRRAYVKAHLPYALQVVHDGEEAINNLQGKPPYSNRDEFPAPDLLLLDLKMPRVDGFDVLKWMRLVALVKPPVIVFSVSDLEEDKSLAL